MADKTYCELTDEQRLDADKLYYLLGESISKPLFTIRNNQVLATLPYSNNDRVVTST